jgi:transcription elongation factor Elf1
MSKEKKNCSDTFTCPYCGHDVFVQETNTYRLHKFDDGTIESKLVDTDLSVSCENYNCEADLRNWIDSEIKDGNIHGVTWFDK